jgi:hypothetical protein
VNSFASDPELEERKHERDEEQGIGSSGCDAVLIFPIEFSVYVKNDRQRALSRPWPSK